MAKGVYIGIGIAVAVGIIVAAVAMMQATPAPEPMTTPPAPAPEPMTTPPAPAPEPMTPPKPFIPQVQELSPWKGFRLAGSGPTDPVLNDVSEQMRLFLRSDVPGSAVDSMPSTPAMNIEKMNTEPRDVECGFTFSFLAKAAMNGMEPFKEKRAGIAGVANLYNQGLHFIVREDAKIDSIAAMKEMKIKLATLPEPEMDELLTRWLLSEYGISYKDIESAGGSVKKLYIDPALMELKEGSVDAIALFAPIGNKELKAFFEESKGLKILSVGSDVAQSLESKRALSAVTIPAGTYKGVTADVQTIGSNSILICTTQLPNDIVQTVTKVLINNREKLTKNRPELASLDPTKASIKDVGIALHPGAEAYYSWFTKAMSDSPAIVLKSAPTTAKPGDMLTFRWDIVGSGNISHTAVHFDTKAGNPSDFKSYTNATQNFVKIDPALKGPREFMVSFNAPKQDSTIYFVIHAMVGDQALYLEGGERTVDIKAPPGTTTTPPAPTPAPTPAPGPFKPVTEELSPWKGFRIGASGDPVVNDIGEQMRLLLRKDVAGSAVDSLPSTAIYNINKITTEPRDLECGFTFTFLAIAAMNGMEPYKEKMTTFAGVADLYKQGLHFIVRSDLPINSITDIKDKAIPLKLATGPEGDTDDILTRWLLAAYRTSYKDIESAGGSITHTYSIEVATSMLKDGSVDAISVFLPISSKELRQLAEEFQVKILPVDKAIVMDMQSMRMKSMDMKSMDMETGLSTTVIPIGTYQGVRKDIPTVGSDAIFICTTQLPSDIVQTVTRVLIDNREAFAKMRPEMSSLKPETAWKNLGIPLHPGAEAYSTWFMNAMNAPPAIVLKSAPTTAKPGDTLTFRWAIVGSGNISHTAVHFDIKARDPSNFKSYTNTTQNFVKIDPALKGPREFMVSFNAPNKEVTIYFIIHAIVKDPSTSYQYSLDQAFYLEGGEHKIAIKKPPPPPPAAPTPAPPPK